MPGHVGVSRAGGGVIDVTWLIGAVLPNDVTIDIVESGDAFTVCLQRARQSVAVRANAVTGEWVSPADPIDPELELLAHNLMNRRLASRHLMPVGPHDVGPAVRQRRALRVFAEVTGGVYGVSSFSRARDEIQPAAKAGGAEEEAS